MVDDQAGRLTFAQDIARGIRYCVDTRAGYGIYNLTGVGDPVTWGDVARTVFRMTGHDPGRFTGVSTDDYFAAAATPPLPGRATVSST